MFLFLIKKSCDTTLLPEWHGCDTAFFRCDAPFSQSDTIFLHTNERFCQSDTTFFMFYCSSKSSKALQNRCLIDFERRSLTISWNLSISGFFVGYHPQKCEKKKKSSRSASVGSFSSRKFVNFYRLRLSKSIKDRFWRAFINFEEQ